MTKLLNQSNISLPLAVWLAADHYDYNDDPNTISATAIMRPLKQTILGARVPETERVEDISGRVSSSMGNAIHADIEHAWLTQHKESMTKLGYPKRVIEAIRINPTPEEAKDPDIVPVYMEQRISRKLGKWTISGKFDFLAEGQVEDFKSTSVFGYMKDNKAEDYSMQGSIYRWIDPDLITQETVRINFIFTDWSKAKTFSDPNYPKNKVASKTYPLKSQAEIQTYLHDKLGKLESLWDAKEEDIPECSDKELWRTPDVFKYFAKPDGKRATKNFDNYFEAQHMQSSKGGKGRIDIVKGQVKACAFCPAITVCKQKDKYLASGELEL